MRNRIKFIIIMVMAIVCTMTANAQKSLYYTQHRFVRTEYGKPLQKNLNEAYCPARIELDINSKTLLIKTETYGTASYNKFDIFAIEGKVGFFDEKSNKLIGAMVFTDTDYEYLEYLVIYRNNGTRVIYVNKDNYVKGEF